MMANPILTNRPFVMTPKGVASVAAFSQRATVTTY